jgi:UPF0755 protein
VARSPSEHLEPTRPLVRSRRRHYREPGSSSGLFRLVSGVFTLLLLLMAIAGAAALGLHNWVNAPGPLTASKSVVIPKGGGVHDIAARLEREGVISDRRLFIAGYFIAKASNWGGGGRPLQLKAGDYQMPQAASIRNVIDILAEGRTITHRVTLPEGLTSHQIVERLKADPNLSGEITEVPPEGSLLPETFIVQRGASRQSIIDNMQAEARKLMEKAWAQRQKGLPLKTWEEAIVLASIVEKETGRSDERERVAAVFVNRLRQNMRLQSDPTILYGISAGKTAWNRPILKSEIAQRTAHNTYQIDGLPPTPICNPGRASIEAVLSPASTKHLYFVADGNGGHVFAETLKEHNANVQKWRALEREKEKEKAEKEKAEKEKESKTKTAAPSAAPVQPGKPPASGPTPAQPQKAAEKTAPPQKAAEKKGAVAPQPPPAGQPAPPREEGPWVSTTEPAQPKSKR